MAWQTDLEPILEMLAEAKNLDHLEPSGGGSLNSRTRALVRIGAAVCGGASGKTLEDLVSTALQAGATTEDVLGAFLCVASFVGEPRVVAVTPHISEALGYDIEAALERG